MAAKGKGKKRNKKRSVPKSVSGEKPLRRQLAEILTWGDAHVDWKKALAAMPVEKRGVRPAGMPHSPWELLEHARIAQQDILDFCTNPKYEAKEWPAGYWPKTATPPDDLAWEKAIGALAKDAQAMAKLVERPGTDLFVKIPHGSGQTILREVLLLADHSAYHLGQFVLVRRMLGAWDET